MKNYRKKNNSAIVRILFLSLLHLLFFCFPFTETSPAQTTPSWDWGVNFFNNSGSVFSPSSIFQNLSGNIYHNAAGPMGSRITKFDPTGKILWEENIEDSGNCFISNPSTDGKDNLYYAIAVYGKIHFKNYNYHTQNSSNVGRDIIIVKISPDDECTAIDTILNLPYNPLIGNTFSVNNMGHYVLCFGFSDYFTLNGVFFQPKGDLDLLVIQSINKGKPHYAVQLGGYHNPTGHVVIDNNDAVYVECNFSNFIYFGDSLINGKSTVNLVAGQLKNDGTFAWIVLFNGFIGINNMILGSNDDLLLCGSFRYSLSLGTQQLTSNGSDDILCFSLSKKGIVNWSYTAGGISGDVAQTVTFSMQTKEVFLGGYFQDIGTFGNAKISSKGYTDLFVVGLDSRGRQEWVKSAGTEGSILDEVHSLHINSHNKLIVQGYHHGSLRLDTVIINPPIEGLFLAEMSLPTYGGVNLNDDKQNNFRVFYDRSTHLLSFDNSFVTNDNFNLTMYNSLGMKIISENISANRSHYQTSLSTLSNGVYFVQIIQGKNHWQEKFILGN